MLTDKLTLLFSDLRHSVRSASALGIVENIEVDTMTFPLCFCHNAVLLFATCLDSNIVLGDPPQHIDALADIDNHAVDFDTVNPSVLVLVSQSIAFHPRISVIFISCH